MASSGKATMSAPSSLAICMYSMILRVLPARSPTVQLTCAIARRSVLIFCLPGWPSIPPPDVHRPLGYLPVALRYLEEGRVVPLQPDVPEVQLPCPARFLRAHRPLYVGGEPAVDIYLGPAGVVHLQPLLDSGVPVDGFLAHYLVVLYLVRLEEKRVLVLRAERPLEEYLHGGHKRPDDALVLAQDEHATARRDHLDPLFVAVEIDRVLYLAAPV